MIKNTGAGAKYEGASAVLSAAALTYVAAMLQAVHSCFTSYFWYSAQRDKPEHVQPIRG
jgi:Zn-dependent membrane protease YugP